MKKILFTCLLGFTTLFAQETNVDEEYIKQSADCLILQDENSIICKYSHEREEVDTQITVQWINPKGDISRERVLTIPAGHGSIYDFRYIQGRMEGNWQFKVKDGENETVTSFSIE